MAALVFLVVMLGFISSSDAAWCVCKPDLSDAALQRSLDYACGAGGDCNPILQNGTCFNPNTVKAHCSYAVNSYYQRKGQAQLACDFSGTATLTQSDPSTPGCSYPASTSTAGTSSTPSTNPNPGSSTPSTLTPTPGTGGVIGGTLGPSSSSVSPDTNVAAVVPQACMSSLFISSIIFSFLLCVEGFMLNDATL